MLHRCGNGILTPLTTPASDALPSAIVHLSRGVMVGSEDCSDSCLRKSLVLEGLPLSFQAGVLEDTFVGQELQQEILSAW